MGEETAIESKEAQDTSEAALDKGADSKDGLQLEEMMAAGLHFGHKTSKTHPKMKPYIAGVRNTIHIINLEKTKEKLQEALEALANFVGSGKVIMFVGTKIQIKQMVKDTAVELGVPYVTERWIGGLLTNFETIRKRVEYLKDLKKMRESEDFAKYTKKERLKKEEEIQKLEAQFGGVAELERLPDALFIFDIDKNQLALREAKQKRITVFAICDTNCDPTSVDYAIPANDDALSSIKYITKYITDKMKKAIQSARSQNPGANSS